MVKFIDNSDKAMDWMRDSALKAIEEACILVETSAVLNAPPGETGKLAQDITHQAKQEGSSTRGFVGTNTEYALFVELGTGEFAKNGDGRKTPWRYQADNGKWYTTTGQRPQPFLEPAFIDNKEQIKRIMTDNFKKGLG